MEDKNTIRKGFRKRLISAGLALGAAGFVYLSITSIINQNRMGKEKDELGYAHLSERKIEYVNGLIAEGFDDNKDGILDRIEGREWIGLTYPNDKDRVLIRSEYNRGDQEFSKIEKDILNEHKK